jgi:hypothetical protein
MNPKLLLCSLIFFAFTIPDSNSGGEKKQAKEKEPGKIVQQDLPSVFKMKPRSAKQGDDDLRRALIARYNIALLECQKRLDDPDGLTVHFKLGATDQCVKRFFEADLSLAESPQERLSACARYLELAKFVDVGVAAGRDFLETKDPAVLLTCQHLRADAEVRVVEARRAARTK